MPEIKHTFSAAKMNKDLDERLVANGEYRDAMNIQIRTTDSSSSDGIGEAGTVQNIQGNEMIAKAYESRNYNTSPDVNGEVVSKMIGSVSNERNDTSYFFISGYDLEDALAWGPNNWTNKRRYVDTIMEVKINDNFQQSAPVVIDQWAVTDTLSNTLASVPSGGFQTLDLTSNISDDVRVGMSMKAYDANGEVVFYDEIRQKSNDTITLYNRYSAGGTYGIQFNGIVAFSFSAPRVLNFNKDNRINAINIIDNLLFWVDGKENPETGKIEGTEPKKINIDRCKAGSRQAENVLVPSDWYTHTKIKLKDPKDDDLLVDYIDDLEYSASPYANNFLKEEHITVVRKNPRTAPELVMSDSDRTGDIVAFGIEQDFVGNADIAGDEFASGFSPPAITVLTPSGSSLSWYVGDILIFTEETGSAGAEFKVVIDSYNPGTGLLSFTVSSVGDNVKPQHLEIENSGMWTIELEQKKPLFELSMARFGYRYIYEDGEYSSYSPWSELAFLPGRFDYDHRRGYNLGMVNNLRHLKIRGFVPHQTHREADVIGVDILYKTTTSPNVYIVKTIKRKIDNEWEIFTIDGDSTTYVHGEITITSEMIHRSVDANQLLRAWDNVPRYALAQEIAANRVMFGNYVQGYDIRDQVELISSHKFDATAKIGEPKKSVKTIRNYKFGMVFGDKYGRETPVISNGYLTGDGINSYEMLSGDIEIEKEFAHMRNRFMLHQQWENVDTGFTGYPEDWMEYVKYYVKETSSEYYNLVMDRWYRAEDGNVWLSFASADRNKVDQETYLVLKNEHGNNEPVEEKARYKIIAIENEAPDFIKIQDRFMGRVALTEDDYPEMFSAMADYTGAADSNAPYKLMTERVLTISADNWQNYLDQYPSKGTLKVRIVGKHNGVELNSRQWQTVTYFGGGGGNPGIIRWNYAFGEAADMRDRFQAAGDTTISGLQYFLEFKEQVVVNEQPQFDGKFFVKIEKDSTVETKVMKRIGESIDYDNISTFKMGYIDTTQTHPSSGTEQTISPRASYTWFNDGSIAAVDNTGETNPEGVLYSEGNVNGGNIASVSDFDTLWGDSGDVSQEGEYFALGCDGSSTPGSGGHPSNHYISNHAIGKNLVNWGRRTRFYWNWYKDTVEPLLKVRVFLDSARLRWGKLTGPMQTTAWQNIDDPEDWTTQKSYYYYKPTGLDPGVQSENSPFMGAPGGINRTEGGEFGRMFISTFNVEEFGFENGAAEAEFRNHMTTPGNMFRFVGCPGDGGEGYVYRVVGVVDHLMKEDARNIPIQRANIQPGYYWAQHLANMYENGGSSNWTDYNSSGAGNDVYGSAQASTGPTLTNIIIGGQQVLPGGSSSGGVCVNCQAMPGEYSDSDSTSLPAGEWDAFCRREGFRIEFRRISLDTNDVEDGPLGTPGAKGLDPQEWDPRGQVCHDGREALRIRLVGSNISGEEDVMPVKDAACWETEPKENVGLDIYYEASHAIPMHLNNGNNLNFIPMGCKVGAKSPLGWVDVNLNSSYRDHHVFYVGTFSTGADYNDSPFTVIGIKSTNVSSGTVDLHATNQDFDENDIIYFEHPDGTRTMSMIVGFLQVSPGSESQPAEVNMDKTSFYATVNKTGYYGIHTDVYRFPIELGWHNCYSFGNGVESDRIRDDYNASTIDNGVKVSTTFLNYGRESKGSTIIYSGIYNSISGVNNLNEFNMAEKITKDLNPAYGSIQALKTRDTDVIVLAEDKVLKVITNKDALFNADGNAQLTATNRVLGTAIPFAGDYGISKNPESMVSDQYRLYFTDKQRGSVIRLSNDGITPISSVGMKTWFRNNLRGSDTLLGTFDPVSDEYNLSILKNEKWQTISFSEGSKGWISFKSFIPEEGTAVSGKYLTAMANEVWMHNSDNVARNTFYDGFEESHIDVLFNDIPSAVKTFMTCNYEGSQARVLTLSDESVTDAAGNTVSNLDNGLLGDNEYYNLSPESGWWVSDIKTDLKRKGSVPEFINKEGKWFNKISGWRNSIPLNTFDYSEFSIQGIGVSMTEPVFDSDDSSTDSSTDSSNTGNEETVQLFINSDNIDDSTNATDEINYDD